MAYDPNNYINGVDQRTIAQQRKDEKASAAKQAAEIARRKKVAADARTAKGRENKPKPFETPMTVSGKSVKSKTTTKKETSMPNMKKPVPASMLKKATEKAKQAAKVKITGSASSKPQVSNSMIKSQPKTTTKPKAPAVSKTTKTPMPKTTTKAPAKSKMTPQDAAMKKILEKKYGKIYG
jgi:hypothetical protein